jgi:GNAT superfamily N-acetyltransferase
MNMIKIVRTAGNDERFTTLTAQLDKDLWERYPGSQQEYDKHNKIHKDVKAVIAIENDNPVGCGAFRELENREVEIKRMFVQPDYRGRGISKLILQELEKWAKERSYINAKLETGDKQPEAISLYQKAGYIRIANYEPYTHMPESICMQKPLSK